MKTAEAIKLLADLRKDITTQGVSTKSGVNFYYLEEEAKTIYPVFHPLLDSIPRVQPMYGGKRVGGPAVNWKAIVAINNGGYPMISEGNRNAAAGFTERDYSATHKYQGQDGFVTFQSEFTSMGFDDALGLSQSATLNQVLNDEDRMILFGNSGSGGNGFQLGTCGAVTIAGPTAGAGIPNGDTIYVACIALTGWGVTMSGAAANGGLLGGGVQLPFVRTTMNGAQDLINGGSSIISAVAGPSTAATTANGTFTATVAAIRGAMGYAWYVGLSAATSALYFYSVTSAPTVTITSLPANTLQPANASSSVGSFLTDNSANALDFDGLTTWTFGQGGYWKDLGGANLTANGDSTIAEFEAFFDYMWLNYKIYINKIWLGGTLADAVAKKILGAGVTAGVTRLNVMTDAAGRLIGGTLGVGYRQKYGPKAGQAIPVETHPWLPQGVIYFDLIENPFPAAANKIPAVRRIVALEDHFSIKWPYVTLEHQYGVYWFGCLQHYIPFGSGILTGVGGN